MEQSREDFRKLLAFGAEGEKEVSVYLINKGYKVLPLYQFDPDTTPLIIGKTNNLISPDLTIFKNGKAHFIEVKNKNRWVEFAGVRETGCDFKLYSHYKELSKNTGIELYLIFNHVTNKPKGFYSVDIMTDGRYWDGIVNNKRVNNPMYFFNYNDLKKLT